MHTAPHSALRFLAFTSLLLATACGGGGGSDSPPLTAPEGLEYPITSARLALLVDAPTNLPSVQGTVDQWSISPALPAGLDFDTDTGAITGLPTETSARTTYAVTATNAAGSDSASFELAVTGTAHFVYVANRGDDSLSTYAIDAHSGALSFQGHVHAADGEDAPAQLALRPDAQFLYALNAGDGLTPSNVSVYAVDDENRSLTAVSTAAVGAEPSDIVIDAQGEFAYVASFDEDLVYAFSISEVDGDLSAVGAPVACGNGPVDLALDPLGEYLWVVNRKANSISTFNIDDTTGELTESVADLILSGRPNQMAIEDDGSRAYITYEHTNRIVSFDIDRDSGALDQSADRGTGDTPVALAIHPNGRFVFVAERGAAQVATFAIDTATGALSLESSVSVSAGAQAIALDPAGLYAYVLDSGANELRVFSVHQGSGRLSFVSKVRTRSNPVALSVVPGGTPLVELARNVYVLNNISQDMAAYSIDENGSLTEEGTPALAGVEPRAIAVDPKERFVAIADGGANVLNLYALDSVTGAITDAWPPVALAGRARSVVIDPTGSWLFLPLREIATVASFAIDVDNRQLTAVSNVTVGSNPLAVGLDPTGQFLYVSDALEDFIYALSVNEGVLSGPNQGIEAPGNPQQVRFTPAGDYLIAPLQTGDHLATFAIDALTGELRTVLPGREAHEGPVSAAVHRSGRYLYAALRGNGDELGHLSSYSFNDDTARITNEQTYTDQARPRDLALDPNGRFLFSADEETGNVSTYIIDVDTGLLTLHESVVSGLKPMAVAVTRGFTVEALP